MFRSGRVLPTKSIRFFFIQVSLFYDVSSLNHHRGSTLPFSQAFLHLQSARSGPVSLLCQFLCFTITEQSIYIHPHALKHIKSLHWDPQALLLFYQSLQHFKFSTLSSQRKLILDSLSYKSYIHNRKSFLAVFANQRFHNKVTWLFKSCPTVQPSFSSSVPLVSYTFSAHIPFFAYPKTRSNTTSILTPIVNNPLSKILNHTPCATGNSNNGNVAAPRTWNSHHVTTTETTLAATVPACRQPLHSTWRPDAVMLASRGTALLNRT